MAAWWSLVHWTTEGLLALGEHSRECEKGQPDSASKSETLNLFWECAGLAGLLHTGRCERASD
jgi:hypothetical protein